MQRSRQRRPRYRINTGPCVFCISKKQPDYKEVEPLTRFVTERGKIQSRLRTGICQKHQRRVASAIKRARHLALMSFVRR